MTAVTNLAEKIAYALDRSGLRLTEVARRADVPASRLSEWKNEATGRKPSLEQALRLARVLHVPLEWLADTESDDDPPPPLTPEENLLLRTYRRICLPIDEAVHWLWMGADAHNRPLVSPTCRPSLPETLRPGSLRPGTNGISR